MNPICSLATLFTLLVALSAKSQEVASDISVTVDTKVRLHSVSPYLAGACIEDVNHEIYGGLYSQMIFGESFQEPSSASPVDGFQVVGGSWRVEQGVLYGGDGSGPKLVSDQLALTDGDVSVEMRLPGQRPGNGGFILSTSDAKVGADNFSGYEVSLFADTQQLLIGRHQGDFRPLKYVPCKVPTDQWIHLRAAMSHGLLSVFVNDQLLAEVRDPQPLRAGVVGFRQWQRPAEYRNFTIIQGDEKRSIAFKPAEQVKQVSGMWDVVEQGNVQGTYSLVREKPFVGEQCQRLQYQAGDGTMGIANRGLNRWGLCFREGKTYEGHVWIRTEQANQISLALEDAEGNKQYASTTIAIHPDADWQRLQFQLMPHGETTNGRFVIRLHQPGQMDVGYVFLQPEVGGDTKICLYAAMWHKV